MSLNKLEKILHQQLAAIDSTGNAKRNEAVINARISGQNGFGPRYYLAGFEGQPFLRMNSNSYLGLECHPDVIAAEAAAAEQFGTGPGAVRFISGSYQAHQDLELHLATFHGRESAMIFSAAYAAMLAILPPLVSEQTLIVSDALNHNCIINAIRLSRCAAKAVYRHCDMTDLETILKDNQGLYQRVCVVTDGVFSMRGDYADLTQISTLCDRYEDYYEQGIISIVDDSHGVGVLGVSGRGTEQMCDAKADILLATLGKAFGVNGGYIVSSQKVVDYLRETAALYIYSNPITAAEAAAASRALSIVDSPQGISKIEKVRRLSARLRTGLINAGLTVLPGQHAIVAVLIGDTQQTKAMVAKLFKHQILATGLSYPVVPAGEEEIRLQVSADHTEKDIDFLLSIISSH